MTREYFNRNVLVIPAVVGLSREFGDMGGVF